MRTYDRDSRDGCFHEDLRPELRIEGYIGINREVEEGLCPGRNSACRGPVVAKSRECSGNTKEGSVLGV